MCFALYGPLEYHLMAGRGWQPWFVLWLAAALGVGWLVRSETYRLILWVLGTVAVILGMTIVGLDDVRLLTLPFGMFLSPYHLLVFVLGFGLMVLAAFGARPVAFGVWLVGLPLQDAMWFFTAGGLVCGGRYGVFFDWWVRLDGICVPGMYLVAGGIGVLLMLLGR